MKSNVYEERKKSANFKDLVMDSELAITTPDREVGVIIDSTVNVPARCSVVVKKTSRRLGIITKEIGNQTENHRYACVLITVFSSLHLRKNIS